MAKLSRTMLITETDGVAEDKSELSDWPMGFLPSICLSVSLPLAVCVLRLFSGSCALRTAQKAKPRRVGFQPSFLLQQSHPDRKLRDFVRQISPPASTERLSGNRRLNKLENWLQRPFFRIFRILRPWALLL